MWMCACDERFLGLKGCIILVSEVTADQCIDLIGMVKTTNVTKFEYCSQDGTIMDLGDIRRCNSANQINTFIGIDLRHYKSGNFLAKEHITKRGNPYARKILFKCIHNIALASHTNPCHIADFYEKRKRQSQVTSTKPHTSLTMELRLFFIKYLDILDKW